MLNKNIFSTKAMMTSYATVDIDQYTEKEKISFAKIKNLPILEKTWDYINVNNPTCLTKKTILNIKKRTLIITGIFLLFISLTLLGMVFDLAKVATLGFISSTFFAVGFMSLIVDDILTDNKDTLLTTKTEYNYDMYIHDLLKIMDKKERTYLLKKQYSLKYEDILSIERALMNVDLFSRKEELINSLKENIKNYFSSVAIIPKRVFELTYSIIINI